MTTKQSDHETPGVLAPRFVPLQSHHVTSQTGGEAHGETLCRPAGTTQRTDGGCTQVSARPSASRRPAPGVPSTSHSRTPRAGSRGGRAALPTLAAQAATSSPRATPSTALWVSSV